MHLFRRPDYRSEVTQFIDQLKTERPNLEAGQRFGRSLLWDTNVNRAAWVGYQKAEVPQKPYVYYDNVKNTRGTTPEPEPAGDTAG
ncbi:MAG: DUF3460 domain-containing protein [Burkholderiaceae bacterium]|jgi:hypothetical protein|nr:MAG: DUF3460 domain-containing protein [Burkholderiaceae bacterium]